ncbi:MAG TPA: EAL domain-containing protein, partial [Candidatus Saccharimonadia bacterium]|nr:EAL domain-containing protein [Candidatus Saccharimonadia bacterium]
EGDEPTTAFLIESGLIEILTGSAGESVALAQIGPGDLLGEMAVIDASPRTATARAVTDCVLVAIDRTSIHERLDAADPVVRALIRGQLQRYRTALARLRGDEEIAPTDEPPDPVDVADASLAATGISKIRLETQLKQALTDGELEVRFQPIQDIDRGTIAGYEALIRWDHPERGAISPVEFIALAEETSLILPVGRYVFDAVCSALATLREGGGELPFIAVNVSARQTLEEGLLDELVVIAARYDVPIGRVKIEITESLALDFVRVERLIAHCHSLGMKVALDDFGTGYSNLGHLHKLRFDSVKLDQGFIRQMLGDARSLAIVRAVVSMVHALDADMIAEGVETAEQLAMLKTLGVRYAQGYLIGRPKSREDLMASHPAPAL